ncbi:MAG TPA: type II secretion system protein GspM [Candidatus Sulfotelmatobacter sp.]|nr:type II secretion system protein GspM [Candidatus Sulfotelmatobacter sp.]
MTRVGELGRGSSRAAALIVLALLLALAYEGLAVPYLAYVDGLDARVATRQAVLERMRALSAAPDPHVSAPVTASAAALLLPDVSEAQAVGQLQDRLKRFAASDGIELQGIQVLPRAETTAVTRLGVRLRGSGDMPALNRFLYAVETAEPALLVDNLRLQARATGAVPAAAAALDIQLDVVGFRMPEP